MSRSLPLPTGNAVAQRNHRGCGDDARHLFQRSPHVVDGQRVGGDVGNALASALIFGFNLVGADGLDLIQHILFAGHADRHDQD